MIERLKPQGGLILGPQVSLERRPSRGGVDKKSLGEPEPRGVSIAHDPRLVALFAPRGLLDRIRKKLVVLSRKGGRIIPAQGTIAAAVPAMGPDDEGLVYVGTDFAVATQDQEPVVAGVLAHEWGHLLSDELASIDMAGLSWDDIWELRREEEAAADAFAGKALYLLNYPALPLIQFLLDSKGKIETHKYHPKSLRAVIVKEAYAVEQRKKALLEKFFTKSVYPNPFAQPLIAIG